MGAFSCAISHAYLHPVICSPAAVSTSISHFCSSSADITASAAPRFLDCILAHDAGQPVENPFRFVVVRGPTSITRCFLFHQYQRCSHQRHSSLFSAFFKCRRLGFSCWNKRRLAEQARFSPIA